MVYNQYIIYGTIEGKGMATMLKNFADAPCIVIVNNMSWLILLTKDANKRNVCH